MATYEEASAAAHGRIADIEKNVKPLVPACLISGTLLMLVFGAVALDINILRFGLFLRYPTFDGGIPPNVIIGLSFSLVAALLLGHLILRAACKRWSSGLNRVLEVIGLAGLGLVSLGAAFFMSSSLQQASEMQQLFTNAPTVSLWAILAGLFPVTLIAVHTALTIVERNGTKIIEVHDAKVEAASIRNQLNEVSETKVVAAALKAEKARREEMLIETAATEAATQAAYCEVRLSDAIQVREAAEEARQQGYAVEINLPPTLKFLPLDTLRARVVDLRRHTTAAIADRMKEMI